MKVSIIIPVYNVAPYIRRCLDSVSSQTYHDMECILVDDCGTDNSMEIVRQWIEKYNGPIHFHIVGHYQNMGLSAARNTGITIAIGDYVYFLDSDDAITPDCIATLMALATQYSDADFVQGNMMKGTYVFSYRFKKEVPEYCRDHEALQELILSTTTQTACNRLIKRSFLLKNSLYFPMGIYMEDMYWVWFLAKVTRAAAFTNYGTYFYYKNEGSIMSSLSAKTRKKRIHGFMVSAKAFYHDMITNGSNRFQRQYFIVKLTMCMRELATLHSLRHWLAFWKLICTIFLHSKPRFTLYRAALFLAFMPPLCFFNSIKGWTWRLQQYIVSRIAGHEDQSLGLRHSLFHSK